MTTPRPNKGLYYYGARYYDPKVSVWLSVDPLAHEFPNWSPYNFCLNDPVNLVDPDGNAPGDPPLVSSNPMSYFYQGWTEMLQTAGKAVDDMGASISAFFTISQDEGNNTSLNQTTTISVGTTLEDFFTPTSHNTPSTDSPLEVSVDIETEMVQNTKETATVEGVDITVERRSSVNLETGEVKNRGQVTLGKKDNGLFVSQTETRNGAVKRELGVKASSTVSTGRTSFIIGAKASISHTKDTK